MRNIVERSFEDDEGFIAFLKSWWSTTYQRPLKDPMLQEYTPEELMYEYLDKVERKSFEKRSAEQEDDKIEDKKMQEGLDWAAEEEQKELEAMAKEEEAVNEAANKEEVDAEEANKKWMEDMLAKEKEKYGEDFGEDLSIEF